jgi:hypothetical protein
MISCYRKIMQTFFGFSPCVTDKSFNSKTSFIFGKKWMFSRCSEYALNNSWTLMLHNIRYEFQFIQTL